MSWMIRNATTGFYSNGIIQKSSQGGNPFVGWGKRGKVWTDVKYLKEHILKYTQLSSEGQCPETWEVLELKECATPINDWIDAEMVYKLLMKVK